MASCNQRLFISGVDTETMVGYAVSFIEPLGLLDPTGFLLDRFLREFKTHLKYLCYVCRISSCRLRSSGGLELMKLFLNLASHSASGLMSRSKLILFDDEEAKYFNPLPEPWVPDPHEAGAGNQTAPY